MTLFTFTLVLFVALIVVFLKPHITVKMELKLPAQLELALEEIERASSRGLVETTISAGNEVALILRIMGYNVNFNQKCVSWQYAKGGNAYKTRRNTISAQIELALKNIEKASALGLFETKIELNKVYPVVMRTLRAMGYSVDNSQDIISWETADTGHALETRNKAIVSLSKK